MAIMMFAALLGLGASALAQQPTAKELLKGTPSESETKAMPPDAAQGASPRAPKGPQDDFNRGLPRTSVQGFLEAGQAGGGAEFQGFGLLGAGHVEGLMKTFFCR